MPALFGLRHLKVEGGTSVCDKCHFNDKGYCISLKKWCYAAHCNKKTKQPKRKPNKEAKDEPS